MDFLSMRDRNNRNNRNNRNHLNNYNNYNNRNRIPSTQNNNAYMTLTQTPSLFGFATMFGTVSSIIVLIFLFIILGINAHANTSKSISLSFAIGFIGFLIMGLCVMLLPNYNEIRALFQQIHNVMYVVLYTLFALVFYTTMPAHILNAYSYVINALMMIVGIYAFYTGAKTSTTQTIIAYERIQMVITFLCIVTLLVMFYTINPAGILNSNSFKYPFLMTVLLSVFGLLYVIVLLTVPGKSTLFANTSTESIAYVELFKKAILGVLIIVLVGIFIAWIVLNVDHKSTYAWSILNLCILLFIVGLLYKTFAVRLPSSHANVKKNAFFDLVINVSMFIPCKFMEIVESMQSLIAGEPMDNNALLIMGATIFAMSAYVNIPKLINIFSKQGGKQLVNQPVYTNVVYNLGNYQELHNTEEVEYAYAISAWIFIDAVSATGENKYTSLLNFGEKPNVLYNATNNTLKITMYQKDLQNVTNNKLIDFDENGSREIYVDSNVLLQKWNNIVINYSGGTLDIFINGNLVKSSVGVVPYFTYDTLTIGENGGIRGGICNITYFNHSLSSHNIYYLYNSVKNITPPTLNTSTDTILVKQ